VDIDGMYQISCDVPSDINEHLPTLKLFGSYVDRIVEFGVREVVSTWAFLASRPIRLVSYDFERHSNVRGAEILAKKEGIDFVFLKEDTRLIKIEETDLLFIDTYHTASQLRKELENNASMVRKYIIIHDVESYGMVGEDGGPGMNEAVLELCSVGEWKELIRYRHNNGLVILERVSKLT